MDRISILDSKDPEILKNHLEIDLAQLSSEFGGKIEYSWELYETELKAYCKENQERLTALPPKDTKKQKDHTLSSFSDITSVSGSTESKSKDKQKTKKNYIPNIALTSPKKEKKGEKSENTKSGGSV